MTATQAADREATAARQKVRQGIIEKELLTHIEFLASDALEGRAAGTNGGRAAGSYLIQQLQQYGWKPGGPQQRYDQPFNASMRNILAYLPGSDPQLQHEYVLVGAHYDHVGYGTKANSNGPIGYIHNGADDNASGTAALLEVAQAIAQLPTAPRRTLVIAFWDGEEIDLLGSRHWLKQPTVPLQQLKAVLNVDMLGRLREQRVEVYGIRTAAGWRRTVCDANQFDRLMLDFTWKMKPDSDHYPFFAAKIPVVMLHTGLHERYHRPTDDIETLNMPGLEQVTRLFFELTLNLAEELPVSTFREESKFETPESKLAAERPLAPFPGRLGIRWTERQASDVGLPVTEVTPRSPAELAGLKAGDQILAWDGHAAPESEQFRQWTLAAPKSSKLLVQRPNIAEPLELKLMLSGEPLRWGLTWREDPAEPGVIYLSRVINGMPAEAAGVTMGDRIYAVNGQSFRNQDHFEQLLAPQRIMLTLEKDGQYRTATISALTFPPTVEMEKNK